MPSGQFNPEEIQVWVRGLAKLTTEDLARYWKDEYYSSAERDELPRVTLKGLRHTHATLLLELGEHPKVVQERLGHFTITTTMNIYSHVTRRCRRRQQIDLQRISTGLSTNLSTSARRHSDLHQEGPGQTRFAAGGG